MSADLEKLKEFLLRPLFDQEDGTKGFIAPPLVDEQTYAPASDRAKTAKLENTRLRKSNTRLKCGAQNYNCEFVIDLVVLMRNNPNFASSSLHNLSRTSFEYAKNLFKISGFSFDKIILTDISKLSSIKRTWGVLNRDPFLDVLNEPGFLSYDGEILEPVAKPTQSQRYDELSEILAREWALAAIDKAAPAIATGLTQEFTNAVVQKMVDDGVFSSGFDDLDEIIRNKYDELLAVIFNTGAIPQRTILEVDENEKERKARVIDILGERTLSKFQPDFANAIVTRLAVDPEIAEALRNGNSQNAELAKKILWNELGLNHETGPA